MTDGLKAGTENVVYELEIAGLSSFSCTLPHDSIIDEFSQLGEVNACRCWT